MQIVPAVVKKLSQLEIDADKSWNSKNISNFGSGNIDLEKVLNRHIERLRRITPTLHWFSYARSFTVTQDTYPSGIAFNLDGTKMFVVGYQHASIYEYNLGTAYKVSTAVYLQLLDVSDKELQPCGLWFNRDGTKVYTTGRVSDLVVEYDLSTAFDMSTGAWSKSLDVSGQDSDPRGLAFNTDGTKMFMSGMGNDSVYEYNLSTAFDIGTAVYSQLLVCYSQDPETWDITFNNMGSKLFVIGAYNKKVYEYNLITPFDLSTAVYAISKSVPDSTPGGIVFNPTGSKMYTAGKTDDKIYEFVGIDWMA